VDGRRLGNRSCEKFSSKASADREALYPEKLLARPNWAKLIFRKSLAKVVNQMNENGFADGMMNKYLREQGLLPPQEPASPQ
jgi:hypothetical protein